MTRMSKAADRLKTKQIEALLRKGVPCRVHDGYGLMLEIRTGSDGTPRASWLYRYERNKKERWFGLGPLRLYSLKEARVLRDEAEKGLRAGTDPINAKRDARVQAQIEAAKRVTFKQAAENVLALRASKWTNVVHREQWRTTLERYAYPVLGALPISAIDKHLVCKVLEPIWLTKTVTASRVRTRLEKVFDWAVAKDLRSDNPARLSVLENLLPSLEKKDPVPHAAMPYKELPAFLAELRELEGTAARALEFTILTAVRSGEALNATWSEIDLAEKVWTIPAERMKAKKEHKVPLSDRAIEVLQSLPHEEGSDFVFVGDKPRRPLHKRSLFIILRTMRRDITVHGFRSSFAVWANERPNPESDAIEMSLAHLVGSKTERAYNRTDLFKKRQLLMSAWSAYCCGEETTGNVVQLRAG